MPWKIEEGYAGCRGYAVVNTTNMSVDGCHPTYNNAYDHLRALYANEPEKATGDNRDWSNTAFTTPKRSGYGQWRER